MLICFSQITTTNPKKSRITISYPGAMLNIMVKVFECTAHRLFPGVSYFLYYCMCLRQFYLCNGRSIICLICTVLTSSVNWILVMSFLINRTATQMTSIMNLQTLKTWHMIFGVRTQSFLRWVFLVFCILFNLYFYWSILLHWTYLGRWALQSDDSASFKGGRKETKEKVWITIQTKTAKRSTHNALTSCHTAK